MTEYCITLRRRGDRTVVSLVAMHSSKASKEYTTEIETPVAADWRRQCADRALEEWKLLQDAKTSGFSSAHLADEPWPTVAAERVAMVVMVAVLLLAAGLSYVYFSGRASGGQSRASDQAISVDKVVESFQRKSPAEREAWLQTNPSFANAAGREFVFAWAKDAKTDAGLAKASWYVQLFGKNSTARDVVAAREYLRSFTFNQIVASIDRDAVALGTTPEKIKANLWRTIYE